MPFISPGTSFAASDWQMGHNESLTSVVYDIVHLHDRILLPIIVAISVFVLFLLLYSVIRFRASKNPIPSKTAHNTFIEILWTVIPCLILIVIAVPSFRLLYKQDVIPKADVTIKAIGYQWYWGYEYPDQNIAFEANMVETKNLKPNQPRLLETDNHVVVPVNKVVKVLITANDVLHAWAVPSFGVKRDAVPGRINETWFKAEKEGVYYGQCSELCGSRHAFMPITVRVVSEKQEEDCVKRLKVFLLPKDEADEKNAIIEIRAGTGGMEAALFAADLFNMYQKVAVLNGWKVEIINLSNSEGGGYKEIIASIVGRNVFSKLKFESGVHRVQRVPDTETQGRIHTSAATVAVLPEAEEVDVKINDADLRIDVFRSSGPGGQSVNTTDSAVRVTHIPSGIVVSQQDEKSQHKNKAKALKILRSKLYDLQRSQQESERAKARKSQIGTGDRSERIRTYNFPQGRVTDHRINMTLYKLTDFLAGDAFKELSDAIQITLFPYTDALPMIGRASCREECRICIASDNSLNASPAKKSVNL